MSKVEKALYKIKSGLSDKNITFAEVVYVLTKGGFVLDDGKGGPQVFHHPDGRKMVLPRPGKNIKPVYVRQLRNLL